MELLYSGLQDASVKAYYQFSTGALTTDSSGNSHTLTAVSDPAEVAGKYGTAADFDGNDAYSAVNHADFKPTGAFSVSFWFKTTTASTMGIFQTMSINTSYAGYRIGILSSGALYWQSGKATGTTANVDYKELDGNADCNDGVWHFGVITWDTSLMYIYVDGALDNSVAWANAPAYAGTSYPRIACFNTAGSDGNFFTGTIDDVAVWNGKALSLSEINYLYSEGSSALLNMI